MGLSRERWKKVVLGILLPVLFWSGFLFLWKADRKFIEEETRKNGGEAPDWVW